MTSEERETSFRKNLITVFEAAKATAPEALKQVTAAILDDVDKDRSILLDVAAKFDPNAHDWA